MDDSGFVERGGYQNPNDIEPEIHSVIKVEPPEEWIRGLNILDTCDMQNIAK